LRTAIMFFGVRREERRILVTSPAQGDGKTLVSTLLAAAYAQAGFRTILISADLRRPGLEELLGMDSRRHGLTDALLLTPETGRARARRGEENLSTYVQETPLANLSVLTAGSIPPNPVELLSSVSMEALLDELASSFDILILDSAPLLPVSDTRTLVDKVDGVVLVTSIGQSKRNIARAQDTLRPADVKWLGLVLNRVPASDESPAYTQYRRRRPAAKAKRA
jgi:succinoglycan biosynthesis transport protein ExoP